MQQVGQQEPKHLPVIKFRAGLVSATVWKNVQKDDKGEEFETFSIAVERSYKTKEDEWKTTSSFGVNDLPKIEAVVEEAYKYIVVKEVEKEEGK